MSFVFTVNKKVEVSGGGVPPAQTNSVDMTTYCSYPHCAALTRATPQTEHPRRTMLLIILVVVRLHLVWRYSLSTVRHTVRPSWT